MRCWTEALSFPSLPLAAPTVSLVMGKSGSSTEVTPGLSSCLIPTLCTALGTLLPLLAHPWLRITRASAAAGSLPRGQAFPTRLAAGGEPQGAAHGVLEATEKPRSLHKGPFCFPAALLSPASYYLSPANNVSEEKPPWAASTGLAVH